ncbi:MAG: hypothetical protein ACRDHY_07835, partial [Anaerolineales bacterium]
MSPFFSPDGQWIGFFAGGRLKKIFVTGGTPQIIDSVKTLLPVGAPAGAWGDDGRIVFSAWPEPGLWTVAASGGAAEPLLRPAAEARPLWYRRPGIFPGNRLFLFSTWTAGRSRVEAFVPQTNQRAILIHA